MHLASENQELLSMNQSLLAIHFVPVLIKNIVDSLKKDYSSVVICDDKNIELACNLEYWQLGVH